MSLPQARLRLLENLFHAGHAFTLQDICAQVGITSDRHARRLIEQLRTAGIQVRERREGRTKRFFLAPERMQAPVPHLTFDEEEMLALAVAAEAAKAALGETPLGMPLQRAFGKLLAELSPNAHTFEMELQPLRWHFHAAGVQHIDPKVFKALQQAINENRSVRIDYYTASTGQYSSDRLLDPLQIAVPGGNWMLVAWCHRRRALRDFALAGIERVALCDHFFSPPHGFDPDLYLNDRFSALSGEEVYEVRLLVEADRAPYFKRKDYHRTQVIEDDERADGRLVVSYEVAGLEEVRSFVQSWGKGVTVLEPEALVRRLAEEAETLAARYRERRDT